MREAHLKYLACPECLESLIIRDVTEREGEVIEAGNLHCVRCGVDYPIIRAIPRFVPLSNYADGFSFQWHRHAMTQHDRHSRTKISEQRFFQETRWPRSLPGETILEVGCGSGRFTAQAISTGAMVVSCDLSQAVEVNYRIHGRLPHVLIVQADIYRLPFADASFDRLFCLGVLQHTPDVRRSFMALPRPLKSGGSLVVDVYDKHGGVFGLLEFFYRTYYWVRPLTRRVPPERLYGWVRRYIRTMWPVAKVINKIPLLGRRLNRMLLIADYRGRYDLTEDQLLQWSILDTFDMLSPAYDQRQTLDTVRGWFRDTPLCEVDVHYGHNGIEGRGTKC